MRKSVPLVIAVLVLFNVVPTVKFVSAIQGSITLDGDLGDWSASLLYSDPVGDAKWGANNEIETFGFFVYNNTLYIAGIFKKDGWNNFMIMLDLSTRQGYPTTEHHDWGRMYKFASGDIDFVLETWGDGYSAWIVSSSGSFNDISSQVNFASSTTPDGWKVVEIAIPLSAFGNVEVNGLKVNGVATLTGGFDGSKQWVSDVAPDQDILPSWGGSGDIPAPAILWKFLQFDTTTGELKEISSVIVTVSISYDVASVEEWSPANITITVENKGAVNLTGVQVILYDSGKKLQNWTINAVAGTQKVLNYIYTYSPGLVGLHTLKVEVNFVDPDGVSKTVTATKLLTVGASVMLQNRLVTAGYTLEPMYDSEYQKTLSMLDELSSLVIPPKYKDKVPGFEVKMNKSKELFETGQRLLRYRHPYYSYIGALRIYGSYSILKRVQKDIEELKVLIESGLSKEIDGSLADWNESTKMAEDTMGLGQDGANLKALYVDYDDNYLYIALVGDNKASWDIAYGIGIDVNGEESGYSEGLDMWVRRMGFDPPIDFEYYLQWTSGGGAGAQKFGKWIETNSTWDERPIKEWGIWSGITGSSEGLKVLELAIPWDALGGKPSIVRVVAFVTGGYPEDSAVEALPDNPSMHELTDDVKGYGEWTDFDLITVFAEIEVS
ncbi:hypothetical protein K1720_05405 [Thermococcus argininiproducens]|uniref:CARDB domain-containing protein n=1 Tax=Thermococcus argininiproducens TaxID=2866384 RepID=A0A9E7M7S4_9EURY|nr:CARDB domain-containing protein [Thermococcus argininiproducens]USG98995.1 hypothetical protein K1720_05405 [Thermococcus argininiproducens]